MLLKRLYADLTSNSRIVGVRILHAGKKQRFSTNLVDNAVQQGWMSMDSGNIVILDGIVGVGGVPIKYKIVRTPGYYCCHCGLDVGDSITGKAHVAEKHKDKKSPDESNPSGYERINYYDCVRGK
jgi:hypothetical protein